MKSYRSTAVLRSLMLVGVRRPVGVAMRLVFDVLVAGHDEDAALEADALDLRSVEARQHRARDHFIDRAQRGLAAPEIEHAIERAEQRVELMSAEQDRDPELPLDRFD